MLIDTHAHLDFPQYEEDREEVLQRALAAGVRHIIAVGIDLDSSQRCLELSRTHPWIYATVGIHPQSLKDLNPAQEEEAYQILRGLVEENRDRIVAWGEIGLDYYRDYSPRERQMRALRRQLELASELSLPVIIHCREAQEDVLRIIREADGWLKGVFHCFSGDERMAREALELGFYISFAGPLTYPNARRLQEVAKGLPLERIVLETDAPFLAPQSFRGRRNEPAYISHTAERLAELRGLSLEDISRITSLNASQLFGIGEIDRRGRIVYPIRDSLYLNLTNRCTNNCTFCVRKDTMFVKGHNLRLLREPEVEELWEAIVEADPGRYKEVVFCGLGEPTLRLPVLREIASRLKAQGIRVRLNTNGHANLIHKTNVVPQLADRLDAISISLNADTAEKYYRLCQPLYGPETYQQVIDFIRESKRYIPEVIVTVLDMPWIIDLERCRQIAEEELGVRFRIREYNVVG